MVERKISKSPIADKSIRTQLAYNEIFLFKTSFKTIFARLCCYFAIICEPGKSSRERLQSLTNSNERQIIMVD